MPFIKTFLVVFLLLATSVASAQVQEEWVARYNGPGDEGDLAHALAVDTSGNVYVAGESLGSGTKEDYATVKYDANGSELWVARYDGPVSGTDQAFALAVDAAGNVYVTGSSWSSVTADDYATVKYDPNGNELWVARYNGPADIWDKANALALDAAGNVYVTGWSYGSGTWGDYATVKYDPNGNELWVARYNGPLGDGWDQGKALALDAVGNVYVTGDSEGSGTDSDYATVKYDSNGNELWVARCNGPGSEGDYACALAVDTAGNVYVTGSNTGSSTYWEYATVKYDSNGNELWVARYHGTENGWDIGHALALDATGNVHITGRSYDSGTDCDYATIKYDSEGDTLWVRRYSGPGSYADEANALALDAAGNVYVTGKSYSSGTYYDYATIKYDSEGDTVWVTRYNGPGGGEDIACALVVDASSNVYATGTIFNANEDYGTIKYSQQLAPEMSCEALTPVFCRGKNFYFKHTVTNNTGGNISGSLTFSGYSGYACDPGNVLVGIPKNREYPPGVTQQYYFFNVPNATSPGQYSASVGGTLGGYDVFCCMNTDIVQCQPWKEGTNTEWELVEADRPEIVLPAVTSLAYNYPNPFNAATEISYALAEAGEVKLSIYNLRGQLLETVVDGYRDAGEHQVIWDASDYSSGVYFYKLQAGDFVSTKKMNLLK